MKVSEDLSLIPRLWPEGSTPLWIQVRKGRVQRLELRHEVNGAMRPYLALVASQDQVFLYERTGLNGCTVKGVGTLREAIGSEIPTSLRKCAQLFELYPATPGSIRETWGFDRIEFDFE